MSSAIGTLAIMSIMVIIATVCVNEAKANGKPILFLKCSIDLFLPLLPVNHNSLMTVIS